MFLCAKTTPNFVHFVRSCYFDFSVCVLNCQVRLLAMLVASHKGISGFLLMVSVDKYSGFVVYLFDRLVAMLQLKYGLYT